MFPIADDELPDLSQFAVKTVKRRGQTQRQEIEELLKGPNAAEVYAFFDTIRDAEGGQPDLIVGGIERFDPNGDHPNKVGLVTEKGPSTAAGNYQITGSNWYGSNGNPGLKQRLGAKNFNEENQFYAAALLFGDRENGAGLEALKKGDWETARRIAALDWTSVPGSTIGGGKQRKSDWWDKTFETNRQKRKYGQILPDLAKFQVESLPSLDNFAVQETEIIENKQPQNDETFPELPEPTSTFDQNKMLEAYQKYASNPNNPFQTFEDWKTGTILNPQTLPTSQISEPEKFDKQGNTVSSIGGEEAPQNVVKPQNVETEIVSNSQLVDSTPNVIDPKTERISSKPTVIDPKTPEIVSNKNYSESDFQEWRKFTKVADTPETRKRFETDLASSDREKFGSSVTNSVNLDLPEETQVQQPQTKYEKQSNNEQPKYKLYRTPEEAGLSTFRTVDLDFSKAPNGDKVDWAIRTALKQALAGRKYTAENFEKAVAAVSKADREQLAKKKRVTEVYVSRAIANIALDGELDKEFEEKQAETQLKMAMRDPLADITKDAPVPTDQQDYLQEGFRRDDVKKLLREEPEGQKILKAQILSNMVDERTGFVNNTVRVVTNPLGTIRNIYNYWTTPTDEFNAQNQAEFNEEFENRYQTALRDGGGLASRYLQKQEREKVPTIGEVYPWLRGLPGSEMSIASPVRKAGQFVQGFVVDTFAPLLEFGGLMQTAYRRYGLGNMEARTTDTDLYKSAQVMRETFAVGLGRSEGSGDQFSRAAGQMMGLFFLSGSISKFVQGGKLTAGTATQGILSYGNKEIREILLAELIKNSTRAELKEMRKIAVEMGRGAEFNAARNAFNKAGYATGSTFGVMAQASSAYSMAIARGATEDQAMLASLLSAPGGLLEGLTEGALLKRLNTIRRLDDVSNGQFSKGVRGTFEKFYQNYGKQFVKQGAIEAFAEELPQNFMQNAAVRLANEKDPKTLQAFIRDFDDAFAQSLPAFVLGGLMSSGTTYIARQGQVEDDSFEETEENSETDEIVENIETSAETSTEETTEPNSNEANSERPKTNAENNFRKPQKNEDLTDKTIINPKGRRGKVIEDRGQSIVIDWEDGGRGVGIKRKMLVEDEIEQTSENELPAENNDLSEENGPDVVESNVVESTEETTVPKTKYKEKTDDKRGLLNRTPPIPEKQVTLDAQMDSLENVELPAASAVLFTENETVPMLKKGLSKITVREGTLIVNNEKVDKLFKTRKLGKFSVNKLQKLIAEGTLNVVDLIGGKAVDFGDNTAGGTSLVTRDKSGNELVASKISENLPNELNEKDKQNIEEQKQLDRYRFEEKIIGSQTVEPTEKVADDRQKVDLPENVSGTEKAHEAATSPLNDLPEPSQAQKEAGNYKKGHISINGLDISVENPVGSERSGVDEKGNKWSVKMRHHYGYIKRSTGADNENIDVFINDNTPSDFNGDVFIIDQINPNTGEFDEHKVMLGFSSLEDAQEAYLSNYDKDWKGLKSITPKSFDEFKKWATQSVQKAPVESIEEKSNIFDEEFDELFGAETRSKLTDAGDKAKQAVEESKKGLESAGKALLELFSPDNFKSVGLPAFDEKTYEDAKPHFEAAIKHFKASGQNTREAIKSLLTYLKEELKASAETILGMKPYILRYVDELETKSLQSKKNEGITKTNDLNGKNSSDDGQRGDAGKGASNVRASEEGRDTSESNSDESESGNGDLRGTSPSSDGQIGDVRESNDDQNPESNPDEQSGKRDGDRPGDRVPGRNDYVAPINSLTREGSWRETAKTNLQILELVKTLENEGRFATPEEQQLLVKFTGWGASEIANNLFPGTNWGDRSIRPEYARDGWKDLAAKAKELFTPEELQTALQSTQYAHYTSEQIVRGIWSGLQQFGFQNGKILEPGMGTGLFFVAAPENISQNSRYTGIEMDKMTASIAKQVLQNQNVIAGDFVRQKLPNDFFDVAIGNPPFSSVKITDDPAYKKYRFLLHDYFFAKSIDKVRPGGLLVFVTSKGTMDKADSKMREYIAARADLLGAIRLPQTAFKQNAGTEVVTDVIFLRKRFDDELSAGEKWIGRDYVTGKNKQDEEVKDLINEYFVNHPEMVLGTHSFKGSMYRANEYTVEPLAGDIEGLFKQAIEKLPTAVYVNKAKSDAIVQETMERDWNPKAKKEGSLYVHDNGVLMRVENSSGVALANTESISANAEKWLKDYVGVQTALKQAQYDQLNDGDWETSLAELNSVYDKFVKKHGKILTFTVHERTSIDTDGNEVTRVSRKYKNQRLLQMDIESPLVQALERITENGEIVRSPMLEKRTIKRPTSPEIRTVSDALAVSLDQLGSLNLGHVTELMQAVRPISRQDVIEELGDSIFELPDGSWTMADDYLSGFVVDKLEEAQTAAAIDKKFERNVKALLEVQPKPLEPSQIGVSLGAAWIPSGVVSDFAVEELGFSSNSVSFDPLTNVWSVVGAEGTGSRNRRTASAEWGTADRSPQELLDAALNNKSIKVYVKVDKKTVLDEGASAAANDIVKKMRQVFKRWIWADAKRSAEMSEKYNRTFNNIAPRRFDGSHLTLPGLSSVYRLHPHQARVVWRILQTGNTYLAHAVGAGKTLEMIVSGMEQRRLGLIRKPMYVVPRHMLKQFAAEFLDAYPMANILVADENNFAKENRRRFVAQAALNDLDAIIITHSAFGLIRTRQETSSVIVEDMVAQLHEAISEAEADPDERAADRKIKRLENRIETIRRRFGGKTDDSTQDDVIDFEDLAVDFLFVDEAHEFRKLDFVTNRDAVKGVTPEGSRRALDLLIKLRWLESQRRGRSAVLASGTPITNTLAELYSIMRFLDPVELENSGLAHFDAWSSQFGEVVGEYEMNAAGKYEWVERFSRFINIPELMKRARKFMDVLTLSQLSGLVNLPTMKGGGPEVVVVPATEATSAYLKEELAQRIETSKKWKPSKDEPGNPDPLINIITDGRLAAIDMRFVDRGAGNDPNSKFNVMIDSIIENYEKYKDLEFRHKVTGEADPVKGAAQIVFSVVGFGEAVAKNRGFDAKAWMVKRLTEAGIPAEEIAFISDYKTAVSKETLFQEMRQGTKKILVGSPKNMGTGVNVQKRLKVLHYLSPPWYPADVEQPDGRIIRQGNQNEEIEIRRYATKGTYDSTAWAMVARKSRAIEQAMTGDDSQRTLEDITESSHYEMASALAAGDSRAIQLAGLRREIERLERLKDGHFGEQQRLKWEKRSTEGNIRFDKERVEKLTKAVEQIGSGINSDNFKVTVNGNALEKRAEIGTALKNAWQSSAKKHKAELVATKSAKEVEIGRVLNKFPLILRLTLRDQGVEARLYLTAAETRKEVTDNWVSDVGTIDSVGLATRIFNAINAFSKDKADALRSLEENQRRLKQIESKIGKPFAEQSELYEKIAEYAQLQKEMAGDDVQDFDLEKALADWLNSKKEQDAKEAISKVTENFRNNNPLFKEKTVEAQSEIKELEKVEIDSRFLENAQITNQGNGLLEVNGEMHELLRRAFEETKIRSGELTPESSQKIGTFDGLFLDPKQISDTIDSLEAFSEELRRTGETSSAERVESIIEQLENASVEGDGTIIAYLYDEAIPHEQFHRAGFVGAIDKALARRHKNINLLFNHSAVQRAFSNFFSKKGYDKSQKALIVEETADYLATGDRELLGLTEDEADNFLLDWAESYVETNGIKSIENFEKISSNFDKIIENTRERYEKSQENSGTRRPVENESGTKTEDDPPRTHESGDRQKTQDSGPEPDQRLPNEHRKVKADERADARTKQITGETNEQIRTKDRKFARSLTKAGFEIGLVDYTPQSEEKWLNYAESVMENNTIEQAIEIYKNLGLRSSEGRKTALGIAIVSELYNQDRIEEMREFGKLLTEDVGNAAQELRATQLLNRYDPHFAQIHAERVKKRASNESLTPNEADRVDELANNLHDISNDRIFVEAALESAEKQLEIAENKIAELEKEVGKIAVLGKKNEDLEESLRKAQARASYYKQIVENWREAEGKSRHASAKNLSELKERLRAKKPELEKRIKQRFARELVAKYDILFKKSEEIGLDEQDFNDLVDLSTLKLIEEFEKDSLFSVADFDKWIDDFTQQSLTTEQIVNIHAEAYNMVAPRQEISDEQKLRMKNRFEHARRARKILDGDVQETEKREKEKSEKEEKPKEEKSKKVPKEKAPPQDQFTKKMLEIALAQGLSKETVFSATAIREFGNYRKVKELIGQEYQFNENEIEDVFINGKALFNETRRQMEKELAERKAGKVLTAQELLDLKYHAKATRKLEFTARRELDRFYNELTKTKNQKIVGKFLDVYNLARSFTYSGDLGFIFRQGSIPLITNTKAWAASIPELRHGFKSKEKFEDRIFELYELARRKQLEAYGTEFEVIGEKLSPNEEYLSRLTDHIPLLAQTNRAHSLTTDAMRLNIGSQLFEEIENNEQLTAEEKEIARHFLARKWTNLISGKGYIGNLSRDSSIALSSAFGAPRFALARIQFFYYTNPVRMAFLPKGARKIVFKAATRYYGTRAAIGLLLWLLGALSLDPEEKDFFKINGNKLNELLGVSTFTDMKIDFTGGEKEPFRLFAGLPFKGLVYALTDGSFDSPGAERVWKEMWYELWQNPYGDWSPFLRGKLNPALNIGINWWKGEDFVGNPYNYKNAFVDLFTPLIFKEVEQGMSYDRKKNIMKESSAFNWKSENLPRAVITLLGSMVGIGFNAYPTRPKTTAYKQAASERGGMSDRSDEEEKKMTVRSNLKFAIREGIDVEPELQKLKESKFFTDKEIENIRKAKGRLPLEDLLFDRDNPATKEKLRRILRFAEADENRWNQLKELAEREKAVLEKLIKEAKK